MLLPRYRGAALNCRFDGTKTRSMLNQAQCGTNSVGIAGIAAHMERDDCPKVPELPARRRVRGVTL
ncbi:MAG: hypothetical protein JWN34_3129 [Bryobacterales bacterium]|nr:hypothetical protein [Bryobacterales bacterium]